jgi:hypothetical protein
MSIPPHFSSANYINFFLSYSFPAWHTNPRAFPPYSLISFTALSTFSWLLELIMTVAPSKASLFDISNPIPVDDAVTIATLF